MAGYGISCFVPNARDVYHSESMTQGLLLEVTESSVWNVLEGSITEHLEQGLVIHSNSPVTAAKDKESGFIKGIGDGKGLPLKCVVAGFSCMGEVTSDQRCFPACTTAERGVCGASAVFLKEPVSDASLGPIYGQAGQFGFVKYADALFNLINDH